MWLCVALFTNGASEVLPKISRASRAARSRSRNASREPVGFAPVRLEPAQIGLMNQRGRGCDLADGPHLDSRPEPTPTLSRRRAFRETGIVLEFSRGRQKEDLNASSKGSYLSEYPTPLAASP